MSEASRGAFLVLINALAIVSWLLAQYGPYRYGEVAVVDMLK